LALTMMEDRGPTLLKLTYRQREVLTALAQRLSNREVARLLHLAEVTAKIDIAALRMRFRHWPSDY
jgi:DNA-binding NarL/FixJ family response regulator